MTSFAAIEFHEVHKSFAEGKEKVLTDVNFSIPLGKSSFLLGPSGGGKTVLLKLMVSLLTPDHGEIRAFGEPLPSNPMQLNRLRKRFGVLFQNAALFDDMTVEENVAFPIK